MRATQLNGLAELRRMAAAGLPLAVGYGVIRWAVPSPAEVSAAAAALAFEAVVDRSAAYLADRRVVDVIDGRPQLVAMPGGGLVGAARLAPAVGETRPWAAGGSELELVGEAS